MIVCFLARHFRSPRQALATDHPPHIAVVECLHALESRYLFDAAGVATGAEAAVDALAQEQAEQAVDNHLNAADIGETSDSSPADNADPNDQLLEALATHQPPAGRREVVFVDTSVGDHRTLIAGIDPSAEVVLLDATRDGVEQIAEVLAGRSGIDAIHIVSHGSQAELQLGTARLTLDSMAERYVEELAAIGQTLTEKGDILIYGCNFGEGGQGQEAAAKLAAKTGADVAASEDLSGHAKLGGDWDLEFRAGAIETKIAFSEQAQAQWEGLLATVVVDTTDDVDDGDTSSIDSLEANKGADGKISLREAILATNNTANDPGSADRISFNIAAALVGGVHTIAPTSALPALTEAVVIDGTTEPDFAGTPMIEINGTDAGFGVSGLTFAGSGGSTVRGLVINRFSGHGISISSGSNSNTVAGNYIGVSADGATDLGNSEDGVYITGTGNQVGGTTAAERNVISGNNRVGVLINGGGTTTVSGNYIGLGADGSTSIGNASDGVLVNVGTGHVVGGAAAGAGNVISGNGGDGIHISSNSNTVAGNLIGLNAAGTVARANAGTAGVHAVGSSNTIGGTTAAERNVISGNTYSGARLDGSSNTVSGNYIGTNAAGTDAIANGDSGVFVSFGTGNVIGGTTAAARNIISGNNVYGVYVGGGSGTTVAGNYIGTDAAGTAAIANILDGVHLNAGTGHMVGGTVAGAGNVISGNALGGVSVVSSDTTVAGNIIGLNAAGTAALANAYTGVSVWSSGNTIGGTVAAARNIVAGNGVDGIGLRGDSNTVQGNYIGIAADGATDLGNGEDGVYVTGVGNLIGGTTAAARNVIAGNDQDGIHINGGSGTTVSGNHIGTNAAGTAAVANGDNGVLIASSTGNTIGGTVAGSGNVISGNLGSAVWLSNADGNTIRGNLIGTDAAGTAALGNSLSNIVIDSSDGNQIGGTTAAARNVISASAFGGVWITNASLNNTVQGNYIGTDITGGVDLGNAGRGVYLDLGSSGNTIGGTSSGEGNLVSGNGSIGIAVNADTNTVAGNIIGLNAGGTAALGNGAYGLSVDSWDNVLGGTTSAARNVISGNASGGVHLLGSSNYLRGNYIGTNAAGTAAIANGGTGVYIQALTINIIGGSTAAERNVISGNAGDGIRIDGNNNDIEGNYIGTNAAGTASLANGGNGVWIQFGTNNTIGGTVAGAGNVISGNGANGVYITSDGNTVAGNYIGLDAAGTAALGNGATGIWAESGSNVIGGSTAAARNVISASADDGLLIRGSLNAVTGNYIGLNAAGDAALANDANGILVESGTGNTIGGTAAGERNVVSGNGGSGIRLVSDDNVVLGNYLGTDATGTGAIGNSYDGVVVLGSGNRIGSTAAGGGNLLSGNDGNGVNVAGANAVILGNSIGTNAAGTGAVSNLGYGVAIAAASTNATVGGTAAGEGNLISGNATGGVLIDSDAHLVLGNRIGTNAAGTAALANGTGISLYGNDNTIGGTMAGAGNLISGNDRGSEVFGDRNLFLGNLVGTNADGTAAVGNTGVGIHLIGDDNVVGGAAVGARNLISGNGDGVVTSGDDNVVSGNYIGTNAAGTAAIANAGPGVWTPGNNNTVGGTTAAEGNLISGNNYTGVYVAGSGNVVSANTIGLNAAGDASLANALAGVWINSGSGHTIGGTTAGTRNVISGNTGAGVHVQSDANTVSGNYIGTNAAGTAAIGNGDSGVVVVFSTGNLIGGTTAAARNIISGNNVYGVYVGGGSGTTVAGNYIGTDAAGTAAIANILDGVHLNAGTGHIVGGTVAGAGNVISGNALGGVSVVSSDTTVAGNIIGLNAAGTAALANASDGIIVWSSGNTIGGTVAAARNVVAGNGFAGIGLYGNSNTVQGNYVGIAADGTTGLGNGEDGVYVAGIGNLIGGTSAAARNIIAGNDLTGVHIDGGSATTVSGNYIGTNAAGTAAIGNSSSGVAVTVGTGSTIGGTTAGSGNLISGNQEHGVFLASDGNTVAGNLIGLNAAGTAAVGNANMGVYVIGDSNTIGGTTAAARNVVSGNLWSGVDLQGDNNLVQGNYIGTNAAGTGSVANAQAGIAIDSGTGNIIGGTAIGAGNVISGNLNNGILLFNGAASNTVQGNLLGTDAAGTGALPNGWSNIVLNASHNNTIGGTSAAARNVMSASAISGMVIYNGAAGNTVQGNYIGTNTAGNIAAGFGNADMGVHLIGAVSGNTIGGTAAGAGNVIAGNAHDGIHILASVALIPGGNAVLGNSIHGNGGLGIELATDADGDFIADALAGATPNDAGDADAGANALQNFPVLSAAFTTGAQVRMLGSLNSTVDTNYRVEFFASTGGDASGHGEGQRYLGFVNVTTDGSGNASFDTTLAAAVAAGEAVSATATNLTTNDTSEFALNVTADLNDAPVITSNGGGATAAVSVLENITAVTTVAATDADVPAQTLTYAIAGGADAARFSINGSTGILTFATAANFEAPSDADADNVYQVTVSVSDGNGGTDMQAIAVTLTNVNELPVVNDQAFSVAENSANGTLVGTVIASDVDAGDTRTFSITAGNTGGAFTINTATGQITVANPGALDFETNPSFTLTVQVQDAGGLIDTATVTVNLIDINDASVTDQASDRAPGGAETIPSGVPQVEFEQPASTPGSDRQGRERRLSPEDEADSLTASSIAGAPTMIRQSIEGRARSSGRPIVPPDAIERDSFKLIAQQILSSITPDQGARAKEIDSGIRVSDKLWAAIDRMKAEMDTDQGRLNDELVVVAGASVVLSVVVAWLLRGGSLLAVLLSTMPVWRGLDPLPILVSRRPKEDEKRRREPAQEDASIEGLFSSPPGGQPPLRLDLD